MIENRYITEKEASELKCPVARTFDEGKSATCDGSKCILWRWREILASDQVFVSAVQRSQAVLAQEDGKSKKPMHYHKQAVEQVMRDPLAHGVKTEWGYCGLGGRP